MEDGEATMLYPSSKSKSINDWEVFLQNKVTGFQGGKTKAPPPQRSGKKSKKNAPAEAGTLFPFHSASSANKTATKMMELIFLSASVSVWVVDGCWCFTWVVERFAFRNVVTV